MPETIIDSDTVPIAVRDFGGPGQPLLLLHGAGGNLAQMSTLAEHLSPAHQVVTVDLRGHGRSGDGPWRWDDVLADLAAVTEHLGLTSPAVVGVSLGGILATLWAQRHPECPGAVSLDGNPPLNRPDQLTGLDPEQVRTELAKLRAVFDGMAAMLAEPLTPEQVAAMLAGQRAMAQRYSAAPDDWVTAFERNLAPGDDGHSLLRPTPDLTRPPQERGWPPSASAGPPMLRRRPTQERTGVTARTHRHRRPTCPRSRRPDHRRGPRAASGKVGPAPVRLLG